MKYEGNNEVIELSEKLKDASDDKKKSILRDWMHGIQDLGTEHHAQKIIMFIDAMWESKRGDKRDRRELRENMFLVGVSNCIEDYFTEVLRKRKALSFAAIELLRYSLYGDLVADRSEQGCNELMAQDATELAHGRSTLSNRRMEQMTKESNMMPNMSAKIIGEKRKSSTYQESTTKVAAVLKKIVQKEQ